MAPSSIGGTTNATASITTISTPAPRTMMMVTVTPLAVMVPIATPKRIRRASAWEPSCECTPRRLRAHRSAPGLHRRDHALRARAQDGRSARSAGCDRHGTCSAREARRREHGGPAVAREACYRESSESRSRRYDATGRARGEVSASRSGAESGRRSQVHGRRSSVARLAVTLATSRKLGVPSLR